MTNILLNFQAKKSDGIQWRLTAWLRKKNFDWNLRTDIIYFNFDWTLPTDVIYYFPSHCSAVLVYA